MATNWFTRLLHILLLNNTKMRNKLIISFSILAIFPIGFVGGISSYYSKKYLFESETNALEQSMHQLNNSLYFFFQTYMDRTNMVFNSQDLQEIIQADASSVDVAMNINNKLSKLLAYIENDFTYPEMKNPAGAGSEISTKIYLSNSTVTSYGIALTLDSIMEEQWLRDLYREQRAFLWHFGDLIKGKPMVSLTRRLVNYDNAEDAGLLQLFIPVTKIANIIQDSLISTNVGTFYLDEHLNRITSAGNSVYTNDFYYESIKQINLTEGIHTLSIGDEKMIVGVMTSTATKWKVVYLTPLSQTTGKASVINWITFATILVALIFCMLIAYGVSTIITRRISLLLIKTKEIDEHNLTTSLFLKGNDELSMLDRNFDKMIHRIRYLIENVYVAQIETNQIKLELLQEQINPHLLYNTLSMIAATAETRGQLDIAAVADSLSEFYKGVLNRGRMMCPIKDEINMVKGYVEIIKYVYKLDIDLMIEIDQEVLESFTIKLLIQPVLENAIMHGIRPSTSGTVVITGRVVEDWIELIISDDGKGIAAEMVDRLNGITSQSEFEISYGITNVCKRIKMFLGESYGLHYASTPGIGTTVTIRLPRLTGAATEQQ